MITWTENNGSFVAKNGDKYAGLVSQHPIGTMDEGQWGVSLHTADEGLICLGPFSDSNIARGVLEFGEQLGLTYAQWQDRLATSPVWAR